MPTTERGLVISVNMTAELVRMASTIQLRIAWLTGLETNDPDLVVTPESDALQPQRLTLVPARDLDDAGRPLAGVQLWNATYSSIKAACPGADSCTVRFRVAPKPGSETTDLAGTMDVTADAVGESGESCEGTPSFSEGAAISLSFEPIDL